MRSKRARWLALTLLSFIVCAQAEEPPADAAPEQVAAPAPPQKFNLWINGGMFSWHFDHDARFRDKNWGYGVQSDLSPAVSLLAGNFINSDNARSNYIGAAWQPLLWHGIRMGIAAGGFDGYPAMRNGGWFAAAIPWVSIRNDRFGVNLTLLPNYANRLHGALAVQFVLRAW